jgi:hypothetical protein
MQIPFFSQNNPIIRPKTLGTTFSQLQCTYLDLPYLETYQEVLSLGFDVIRLAAYWNELEAQKGQYDFAVLDSLLDEADKNNTKIILAVGMKTPRWPEFHLPEWVCHECDVTQTKAPLDQDPKLVDYVLTFIEQVIRHTRDYKCIQYFQVENEGLGRVGIAGNRYLSPELLSKEIDLVKSLKGEDQKIFLSNAIDLWPPNSKEDTQLVHKSIELGAEAVGINVYTKVPIRAGAYLQPTKLYWNKLHDWNADLKDKGIEGWIAEAQAEPWEHGNHVHIHKDDLPSSNPDLAIKLASKLTSLGYQNILLWGCEHWYWHKKRGNLVWWDTMQEYIKISSK